MLKKEKQPSCTLILRKEKNTISVNKTLKVVGKDVFWEESNMVTTEHTR